jgi:hypothetical protein
VSAGAQFDWSKYKVKPDKATSFDWDKYAVKPEGIVRGTQAPVDDQNPLTKGFLSPQEIEMLLGGSGSGHEELKAQINAGIARGTITPTQAGIAEFIRGVSKDIMGGASFLTSPTGVAALIPGVPQLAAAGVLGYEGGKSLGRGLGTIWDEPSRSMQPDTAADIFGGLASVYGGTLMGKFAAQPAKAQAINVARLGRNAVRSDTAAARLMGSVLGLKRKAFMRGEDPRVAVVEEGLASTSKGSFQQNKKTGEYEPISGLAKKIQEKIDSYTEPIKRVLDQASRQGQKLDAHTVIDAEINKAIRNIERTSGTQGTIKSLEQMRTALKSRGKDLSPNEIVEMRNDLRRQNKLFEETTDVAEASLKDVREDIYHGLNESLETAFPNIRNANRRAGGLITAYDALFENWAKSQGIKIGGQIDIKSPATFVPAYTAAATGLSKMMGTVRRPAIPQMPQVITQPGQPGAIGPSRLALPAGQYVGPQSQRLLPQNAASLSPVGSAADIPFPKPPLGPARQLGPSDTSRVSAVNAEAKSARDPKTGQFKKTYSSDVRPPKTKGSKVGQRWRSDGVDWQWTGTEWVRP